MAQLQKMMIQGIRSFGPDDNDKQIVVFFKPLTLILGQNGCGKTTIIEALKYAITGDLPPGGKQGHSFVYDPKLARQTEVLGKVQLKLTDVKGKELVVTRCVQVIQKKTNMQFKTLDTSISRKGPDGKAVQSSGRCIDVDIEMATSLGVSKSIINNVILCHQEDSLWPLEEAKKLKERFDAIFDTIKHNKCLLQINEVRKSLKNEITLLKNDLIHLHDKKQAACRMKEAISDTERNINVARDQVDKCKNRCQPINERLEEINEQESNYYEYCKEVEKLNNEIKNLREQQQDLRRNIHKLFEGTVEDLKDAINNFQPQVREKEGERRDLCGRIETIDKEIEKMNNVVKDKIKKIGELESVQQTNNKTILNRNNHLEKLRKDLNIEGSSVSREERNVRSLMEKVEQKIHEKKEVLIQLQSDLDEEVQRHQNRLDTLRDSKVKKEQEIKMREEKIGNKISSKDKIQSDIEKVERAASRLAQVEKDLTDVKANLDKVAGEVNVDVLEEDIRRFEADEHRVHEELEKVYREVQELQMHSKTQTQLAMKRSEYNQKESDYNRLKNKNADTLKHLLGTIPEIGLKRKFEDCLDQIVQDINVKNRELRNIQNEISKIEVNRKHKKEQVDAKEKEIKEDEEKIYEYCEDRDLEDVIKDLDDKIQEMRDMKGMLASQEVLYQKYVQKLQEREPCCPLCHRNFDRIEEASTLVDELRGEVRTLPVRLRNNNEKLEKSVRQYDTLLQLKSTNERLRIAKETVLPKLRKELKDVENQLRTARERSEELQNDLLSPQTDEGTARSIQSDVFLMDKCLSEMKLCKTEISKLQAELPSSLASSRTLEEAMSVQNDLRKEESELRQNTKSYKDTLDSHRNKMQRLHAQKNALVEEQLKIQGGTQQLQQMRENIAELEVQIADLEEQIQLLKSDVTIVRKEYEDARRTLEEVKLNNRAQIKSEEGKVNDLKSRFKDLVTCNKSIDEFERSGINIKLATIQQEVVDLQRDEVDLKSRRTELSERVDKLNSEISGQKVYQRELQDNLQLMEKQKDQEKLSSELIALTKSQGTKTQSYNQLVLEKKKLESDLQSIQKEAQQAEGRVEEMQKRLISLRKEMAEEMYEGADKKYSEALRKKTVKEMIDTDLAKYYKAMEWTMTQFHQERMKVINEIIHDMWRHIYRGNDIDYIKIEANSPDTTDSTKRRSYDYRVVQVKNDIEIDMRGRCSAGQKVLACLIIRMALAETLSSQCGILALDEPTTNLDRENIESLADALAQIVNTRMVNKGFQLIVITHDEDFVNHLKQGGQLSHYHSVVRNEEGKSRIRKHAVQ